jgi:hypothetical protein
MDEAWNTYQRDQPDSESIFDVLQSCRTNTTRSAAIHFPAEDGGLLSLGYTLYGLGHHHLHFEN